MFPSLCDTLFSLEVLVEKLSRRWPLAHSTFILSVVPANWDTFQWEYLLWNNFLLEVVFSGRTSYGTVSCETASSGIASYGIPSSEILSYCITPHGNVPRWFFIGQSPDSQPP